MKKLVMWFFMFILGAVLLAACTTPGTKDVAVKQKEMVPEQKAAQKVAMLSHPALSEQEKYIPCSECHAKATPEVYKEWADSLHGMTNVKCFQCHGTFETFQASPDELKCMACHPKETEHKPEGKHCVDCHLEHRFTAHK